MLQRWIESKTHENENFNTYHRMTLELLKWSLVPVSFFLYVLRHTIISLCPLKKVQFDLKLSFVLPSQEIKVLGLWINSC
jgi:hypothetical protein